MSFKKFAMLILTVVMISGFTKPVSASANDDVATAVVETVAEEVSQEVISDDTVQTGEEKVSEEIKNETADEKKENVVSEEKAVRTEKGAASKKTVKKAAYTKQELRLMASIINCEAGGESFQGKLAVAIVVMNRVDSKLFPNTIKKVIYQKNQFSPVRNGMLNKKLKQYDAGKTNNAQWKSCISAAKKVLNGQRTIIYKGKTKNLSGFHFFSVVLPGARIKLGGHRFK